MQQPTTRSRVLGAGMSLVLALGLTPAVALADDTGDAAAAPTSAVEVTADVDGVAGATVDDWEPDLPWSALEDGQVVELGDEAGRQVTVAIAEDGMSATYTLGNSEFPAISKVEATASELPDGTMLVQAVYHYATYLPAGQVSYVADEGGKPVYRFSVADDQGDLSNPTPFYNLPAQDEAYSVFFYDDEDQRFGIVGYGEDGERGMTVAFGVLESGNVGAAYVVGPVYSETAAVRGEDGEVMYYTETTISLDDSSTYWVTTYDGDGVFAMRNAITTSYGEDGTVITVTDVYNVDDLDADPVTTFVSTTDEDGYRTTTMLGEDGAMTEVVYDPEGNVCQTRFYENHLDEEYGYLLVEVYDADDKLMQTVTTAMDDDGVATIVTTFFDEDGETPLSTAIEESHPNGTRVTRVFDGEGTLTAVFSSAVDEDEGTVTSVNYIIETGETDVFTYTAEGELLEYTVTVPNEDGSATTTRYNAEGEAAAVQEFQFTELEDGSTVQIVDTGRPDGTPVLSEITTTSPEGDVIVDTHSYDAAGEFIGSYKEITAGDGTYTAKIAYDENFDPYMTQIDVTEEAGASVRASLVPTGVVTSGAPITISAPEGTVACVLPLTDEAAAEPGTAVLAMNGEGEYEPIALASVNKDEESIKFMLVQSDDESVDYIVADNGKRFRDVQPTDWYADVALRASAQGIMEGSDLGDGLRHFNGTQNLTRAQLAQILMNIAGTAPTTQVSFKDVKPGDWYATAVAWAVENEVASGYASTNEFKPTAPVTRAQACVMIRNFAEKVLGAPVDQVADVSTWDDGASLPAWQAEAMGWATDAGIITGKGGKQVLDPNGTATRAQGAAMILRMVDYVL